MIKREGPTRNHPPPPRLSSLPPISLPRQIAHDVPLMKRSTKPASPSSDSGRRDSSRGKGRRGGFREVTRTRLACRPRGALVEKVETNDVILISVDRFEGYGVIKRLVKREDREESRERKKEIAGAP
ncbi:hypothetical protein ALC62_06469 [Cyphomyrmex costatus]|uniref:Uncharacterized protein n=1 Tax=Cyphomyrmex costatus TaxID=456900 RepID=A0A195CPW4_9HYME|nr:hypothetical protein ALC62_06469 [Cyphomyrmex costatus]